MKDASITGSRESSLVALAPSGSLGAQSPPITQGANHQTPRCDAPTYRTNLINNNITKGSTFLKGGGT